MGKMTIYPGEGTDVVAPEEPTREELVGRFDDYRKDDPTLDEVLRAFDSGELYLFRNRNSLWCLKVDERSNPYIDDTVWATRGTFPGYVRTLFKHVGVKFHTERRSRFASKSGVSDDG